MRLIQKREKGLSKSFEKKLLKNLPLKRCNF